MSDKIKVAGIFTTKGGVGKTTIALNLAKALSEGGKVLFVDFDTNYTVSALLKCELAELEKVLDGDAKPTVYGGINLVYGGAVKNPDQQLLKRFWELVDKYDYSVLDFHNSATPIVVALLQGADRIIVPVVPTMAGMGAFIHTMKVLERLGVEKRAIAVFNQVHKSLFGVRGSEMGVMNKIRGKEGIDVWGGFIPYDKAVADAEIGHNLVPIRSAFGKAIRKLCQEVMGCRR